MKRILIIKLWALGDILMATPLLTALRQYDPDIHITWVADAQHADILKSHPLIDDLISFDSGHWRRKLRHGMFGQWLSEARLLHKQFQEKQFDAAISCHPEKWWIRILSVAPIRIGLYPSAKLPLTKWLYTQVVPRANDLHSTDSYLQAAQALGLSEPFDRRMTLRVSQEDRDSADSFLQDCPAYRPDLPLIVLHPGTSQPTKCWPPEYFASVAVSLPDYNIVVTGSPRERVLAESLAEAMPSDASPPLIAAGRLRGIGETAALVQRASAVVSGDTSLLHIASALEVPLVGIYGSTRPGENAPLFGSQVLLYDDNVSCAPCHREFCPLKGDKFLQCQKAIAPAQVVSALQTLLKEAHEHSAIV